MQEPDHFIDPLGLESLTAAAGALIEKLLSHLAVKSAEAIAAGARTPGPPQSRAAVAGTVFIGGAVVVPLAMAGNTGSSAGGYEEDNLMSVQFARINERLQQIEDECPGKRYLYRGLSVTEYETFRTEGIVSRSIRGKQSPEDHVLGRRWDSPWISTSHKRSTAGIYGTMWGVVQIDRKRLISPILDVSNGIPGSNNEDANKKAIASSEVLVFGWIPPGAITDYYPGKMTK